MQIDKAVCAFILHYEGCTIILWSKYRHTTVSDTCMSFNSMYEREPSSLAKGFAHGPLCLHPWQIELEFVIPADRHLGVFTSLAYKDDITFDQWELLTVSCLGRGKMDAPIVYIFDCIHVMFS